jgi:hypothetical protein
MVAETGDQMMSEKKISSTETVSVARLRELICAYGCNYSCGCGVCNGVDIDDALTELLQQRERVLKLEATNAELRETLRQAERWFMGLDGLVVNTQLPEAFEDAHLQILNPALDAVRKAISDMESQKPEI